MQTYAQHTERLFIYTAIYIKIITEKSSEKRDQRREATLNTAELQRTIQEAFFL